MWGCGLVSSASELDHKTRTVVAHKCGEFVEHLSDRTVTKNLDVQKKTETWDFFFFALSCTAYSEDSMKNTTAITELKQCFGLIRQKPSRFIWRIFFLEIVTPFTVVKRKDCHKLWAYARSPQTPRCGWRRPDLECQNLLWGLSYWIPFFWQTAVFWILVMRPGSDFANNCNGASDWLSSAETESSCLV